MELYKARKCYDYGTGVGQQTPNSHPTSAPQQQQQQQHQVQQQQPMKVVPPKPRPPPPADWSKMKPEGQHRYIDKATRRLGDFPPTYFEIDPDGNDPEVSSRRERPVKANNCSVGAHGMEHDVMKRVNQSTHDFTPTAYDHLMDTPGNNNHKSV